MKSSSKLRLLIVATLSSLISVYSYAQSSQTTASNSDNNPNQNNPAVEFKQSLPTTMEELATVDVLGEICPKILGDRMNRQFNQGYQNLVTTLLPNVPSPQLAIQTLRQDTEYSKLLDTARADTARYAVAENRAVCLDVLHYPAPSK